MIYVTEIATPEEFNIKNPHVATIVYNSINGMFQSASVSLNALLDSMNQHFDDQDRQSSIIFYIFLGSYILLVLIQAPLGYSLILCVNKEAMPFLVISRARYLKMMKEANAFLIYIKVRVSDCHWG